MRATADLDLVIWLDPENVLKAFRALDEAGYRPQQPVQAEQFGDATTREKWRQEKQMVVLKMWSDEDPLTPLDIFVYEPFDFKTEYSRAKIEQMSDCGDVPIVSLGTLLTMKSEAGRQKDLLDIEQLKKLHSL
jgi:hypothetical protein